MIIQNLMGGLGNQMFQYAFIRSLALRNNLEFGYYFENPPNVFTRRNYELDIFYVKGNLLEEYEYTRYVRGDRFRTKLLNLLLHRTSISTYLQVKENSFPFDSKFSTTPDKRIYFGYWQSEKYFYDYKKEVRADFSFNSKLTGKNRELAQLLNKYIYTSLHVRHGDYIKNKITNEFHGVCTKEYYDKAVAYLANISSNSKFIIFSDDIKWCKENLTIPGKPIFVDWNKGKESYVDMYLMSLCKHNIIANSSFSWWGAWLNKNTDKIVIAPKAWFKNKTIDTKDLIPKKWIKL